MWWVRFFHHFCWIRRFQFDHRSTFFMDHIRVRFHLDTWFTCAFPIQTLVLKAVESDGGLLRLQEDSLQLSRLVEVDSDRIFGNLISSNNEEDRLHVSPRTKLLIRSNKKKVEIFPTLGDFFCVFQQQPPQPPQPPQPQPGKPKPRWKPKPWPKPNPRWKPPKGKACALATNGPDANSAITAATATILNATLFEFINICYEWLIIKMMTNSISEYHSWYLSYSIYKTRFHSNFLLQYKNLWYLRTYIAYIEESQEGLTWSE